MNHVGDPLGSVPRDEDPVLTHINLAGAGVGFFDQLRAKHESYEHLPAGLRLQVAGVHDEQLEIVSCWDSAQLGRKFFSEVLARNVQDVTHESGERHDFVRNELPLFAFRLGVRATEFLNSAYAATPPSTIYMTTVDLGTAEPQARAIAYKSVVAMAGLESALAEDAVLHMSAVVRNGWFALDVWTRTDAAHDYFKRQAEAALTSGGAGGHPVVRTVSFATHRCLISAETLLSFGVGPRDDPNE